MCTVPSFSNFKFAGFLLAHISFLFRRDILNQKCGTKINKNNCQNCATKLNEKSNSTFCLSDAYIGILSRRKVDRTYFSRNWKSSSYLSQKMKNISEIIVGWKGKFGLFEWIVHKIEDRVQFNINEIIWLHKFHKTVGPSCMLTAARNVNFYD